MIKRNPKFERIILWLFLSISLSVLASEVNKFKIPLPSFESRERIADILPINRRIKPAEINLGSQEGFNVLIEELNKGDDKHQPKLRIGEMGQVSYQYYRKEGEPVKTQKELDHLINNKKEYKNVQQKIAQLLTMLTEQGVLVVLGEPSLKGASGEWDPSRQTIRIAPNVLAQGSEVTLKILNHEVMHVAQSCHNGGINYRPRPLGIELSPSKIFQRQMGSDIYAQIGEKTKQLESEAYSYEYSSKAARHYLVKYCTKKSTQA